MSSTTDALNSAQAPNRVFYSLGRMLGPEDFQADQDYHRGRLARAILQVCGTGTVSGLKVLLSQDPAKDIEIQVTPGIAIDRVGRIIEVPRAVCIRVKQWLDGQPASNRAQAFKQTAAKPSPTYAIVADVFATFTGCTRGVTPCFATQDDYDATDAFSPNRLLDSFAMQLVLRPDVEFLTPQKLMLPEDPWAGIGTASAAASPSATTLQQLQQRLLDATTGPAVSGSGSSEKPPNEIPVGSGLDPSSVFLARVQISATAGTDGTPEANLSAIAIDNLPRLFLYPASLVARWIGLTSGTQS